MQFVHSIPTAPASDQESQKRRWNQNLRADGSHLIFRKGHGGCRFYDRGIEALRSILLDPLVMCALMSFPSLRELLARSWNILMNPLGVLRRALGNEIAN